MPTLREKELALWQQSAIMYAREEEQLLQRGLIRSNGIKLEGKGSLVWILGHTSYCCISQLVEQSLRGEILSLWEFKCVQNWKPLWGDFTLLSSHGVGYEKDGTLLRVCQGEPTDISVSPPPWCRTHKLWITEQLWTYLCYNQVKYKSVTNLFLFFRSAVVLWLPQLWKSGQPETEQYSWPQVWKSKGQLWRRLLPASLERQWRRRTSRGGLGGSALTLLLQP